MFFLTNASYEVHGTPFLSFYGLNSTYAFPFNSDSVSVSDTYIMLKACILYIHAFVHIMFSCRSYNNSCSIFIFSAFNTYWMIALRWSLKNWNEQSCHLFLYVLVCTLRLYHIQHSPLKKVCQGEGEDSPTCLFCCQVQGNSGMVQPTELAPVMSFAIFLSLGTC